jgi:hypothetical protein
MFGLKTDTYTLNTNGNGQYELFADVSTRSLQSVLVGESAGKISKGSGNAFVGFESGYQNLEGSFGVFVGFQAGAQNQNGNFNTFVGAYAGKQNLRGDRNTFVGFQAGQLNANASECTAVGVNAMRENSTGNRNVAVGVNAGERILDGDNNTMIGSDAGQNIRSGNYNTMAGYRSGRASFRGNENTYFGAYAGYSNSFGDGNAFVGFRAGEFLGYGNFNVAVGAYALQKATYGSCNIAIGAFAGSVSTGSGNVYVGTGAGSSNYTGNNNTSVGNNAGYYGQGDNNVYIGKNAALQLLGNENVVIGVNAFPRDGSSGSVVIGYRAATTNFRSGNCNIFIGVGADSHNQEASYAISIGSKNTYAASNGISVGNLIDNSGKYSVLLGYNMISDSDQCVSIGKSIDIRSVEVFNDPLNWRFPVNITQAYKLFYLTENYTNTLYLNGTSNIYAIATIDSSNIYDSGDHLLQGVIRTKDLNLRSLFTYNILYQGATVQQGIDNTQYGIATNTTINYIYTSNYNSNTNTSNVTISSNITNSITSSYKQFINNNSNLILTDNFRFTTLFINDGDNGGDNIYIRGDDGRSNLYDISISAVLNNLTLADSVSSNLIPYTNISNTVYPTFHFLVVSPARNKIQTIGAYNVTINNSFRESILYSQYISPITIFTDPSYNQIELDTIDNTAIDRIEQDTMKYPQKWYVLTPPTYGYMDKLVYPINNTSYPIYVPYPEAMFAEGDTVRIALLQEFWNTTKGQEGLYGTIPDDNDIGTYTYQFTNSDTMIMQSNINIHPYSKTYIDRSYLNIIPYTSPKTDPITCLQLDSNLKLTYYNTEYTNTNINTLSIPYHSLTSNTLCIEVIDRSKGITLPLTFSYKGNNYNYNCIYSSNINVLQVHSNIDIYISPFFLKSVYIPFSTCNVMLIDSYPSYGTVVLPTTLTSPITYTPRIYNFDADKFTIIAGDGYQNYGNHTYLHVNIITNNNFDSLLLHKMQENMYISPITYNYTYSNDYTSNPGLLFNTYYSITNISTGAPWSSTSNYKYAIPYHSSDDTIGGYLFNCNITMTSNYVTISDIEAYLGANPSISNVNTSTPPVGLGVDYIFPEINYPRAIYSRYSWNYPANAPNNYYDVRSLMQEPHLPYEMRSNGLNKNNYYTLQRTVYYDEIYKLGCNLYISHSNRYLWHDIYEDMYNNHIYTSNYYVNYPDRPSSNVEFLTGYIPNLTYSRVDYHVLTERYISSNIPTVLLDDTLAYHKGSYYQLDTHKISCNLILLQQNKGRVTFFHQSNITNKEIHIWNTKPANNMVHILEQSNVYFVDKTLTINYSKKLYDSEITPIVYNNVFVNRNSLILEDIAYDTGNQLTYFSIQHTCNISLTLNGIPTRSFTYDDVTHNRVRLLPTMGYSNDAFISYMVFNNQYTESSRPLSCYMPNTYIYNSNLNMNIGMKLTDQYTSITSNHLYYMTQTYPYNQIKYKITSVGNSLKLYKNTSLLNSNDSFTQEDINNNYIHLRTSNLDQQVTNFTYDIIDPSNTVLLPSQTFTVHKYLQNDFPFAESITNTCNVILQIKESYQHQLLGSLWNYVHSNITNMDINPDQIFWNITKNPTDGYLYSSNLAATYGSNAIHRFSYNDLLTQKIHYIPYQPMHLSNVSMQGFISYCNIVSPIYTISIKNYWSRWSQLVVPVGNDVFTDKRPYDTNSNVYSYQTSNIPRSMGMMQDNIQWSPSNIYLRGLNITENNYNTNNISTTFTLSYNQSNLTDQHIYIQPLSRRPKFYDTSDIHLNVDNGNFIYLDTLLTRLVDSTQHVTFYIVKKPDNGVILVQTSDNQFIARPYFTSSEIKDKKVFYQHHGYTQDLDTVIIKVSSHPCDISRYSVTLKINVLQTPQLIKNNYDYIYYEKLQEGQSNYNILDSSKLDITSGRIYIYDKNYIDIYTSNFSSNTYSLTNSISKDDIVQKKIYYRPSSNLFFGGSNNNKTMSFKFIANNSETGINEPNKLAVFDIYRNLYQQEWFSKYNTFDSINQIVSEISSNQTITYRRFVNTTSNISFENRKCQIQFDYQPYQPSLINKSNPYNIYFGNKYLQALKTFKYNYQLIDTNGSNIMRVDFTQSLISLSIHNSNVLNITPADVKLADGWNPFTFDSQTWNTFYIVNYDELNSMKLSVYLNGINYTRSTERSINSLDFTNLKEIRLEVPIKDPLNYYVGNQNGYSSNIGSNSIIYYNLVNYNTKVRFRNFNIFLATYDINTSKSLIQSDIFGGEAYNIIIGNKLTIKGFNNICLGKNFNTTGTGSVILGSDIGVQYDVTGTNINSFNEIFNSIIISNTSFTNSKVRDIIAIGNNILNDAGGNPLIEDFLSKKPVLIGNDINVGTIDFHINFQNTFLKTTLNTPQIYCGISGEGVCVGYTSNMMFDTTGEYKLFVNGGINVTGPIVYSNGTDTITKKNVFGNIFFTSGTSHTCTIPVIWDHLQTSDYSAFSVAGKFKFLRDAGSYGYRRFEIWINPVNNSLSDLPNAISDLEIASYSTADILGIEHYVSRRGDTSVNINIIWNTLDPLTTEAYMKGTLEIEATIPNELGNITFLKPISTSI